MECIEISFPRRWIIAYFKVSLSVHVKHTNSERPFIHFQKKKKNNSYCEEKESWRTRRRSSYVQTKDHQKLEICMNFLTEPTSETISQNSTKWKGEMRPQQLDGNEKKSFTFNICIHVVRRYSFFSSFISKCAIMSVYFVETELHKNCKYWVHKIDFRHSSQRYFLLKKRWIKCYYQMIYKSN